jgi:NAD(P)H dehydrogenase (quinone)
MSVIARAAPCYFGRCRIIPTNAAPAGAAKAAENSSMKKIASLIIAGLFMLNLSTAAAKNPTTETTVLVLIDSQTGGTLKLAQLLAQGIETQPHTQAVIKRVPSIDTGVAQDDKLAAELAGLPVASAAELPTYDGIAWGSPVYFGNVSANMKKFMDGMLGLWTERALDGMPSTVFMSAGSGAGKESALSAFSNGLAMHGMTLVTNGMAGTEHLDKRIPQGNTPFGITSLTGMPGEHPTQGERAIAALQGAKLAKVAAALKTAREKTAPSATAPVTAPKISATEARLQKLGIVLPSLPSAVGNYKLYKISNKQVYINQVALRNGAIFNPGVVGQDLTEEKAKAATEQTMLNVLAILKQAAGGDLDNVRQAVQLTGYFNTAAGYENHAGLMNVASDLLVEVLGDAGKHARATLGSASLPLNSAVEIQAIFELK